MHSGRPEPVISSLNNPGIKRARALLRRKGRREERAFLVEGPRSVRDAIAFGAQPENVYIRADDMGLQMASEMPAARVTLVSAEVLASLSDVPHPQSIVAVFSFDAVAQDARHDEFASDLIVVADGVRDPGNLGTLIRSAAGSGAAEVIVTPESVDPFNPKCVRAAMGGHFIVPVRECSWSEASAKLEPLAFIAVLEASGDVAYHEHDWKRSGALVVGGEAFGPRPEMQTMSTVRMSIPMAPGLESLNAAVAGSIVLFEAARQRRSDPTSNSHVGTRIAGL